MSEAATPRDAWVVAKLYFYQHPYAVQLPQELQTKMQKMAASPFAFFRGTAPLFFEDVRTAPGNRFENLATGQTWINGDLHLGNFGGFRDANGNVVFDTNDFDEGYLGQYTWDLRRLAVSIVLAARENGLGDTAQRQLVIDFTEAYLNKIGDFRGNNDELGYRLTVDNTSGIVKDTLQKSASQTRADLLAKYTQIADGRRRFLTTDELRPVDEATANAVRAGMTAYLDSLAASKRQAPDFYAIRDIRLKLGSGIGSLGRHRYYVLIEGSDIGNGDDIILQLKQTAISAVAIAAPGNLPAWTYNNHEGQRAARSMKAALSNTDPLVGWTNIAGQPYLVREKSPYEVDFDITRLTGYGAFSTAVQYVGKVVAKNHAASDQDYDTSIVPYSIDKQIDSIVSGNKAAFKAELADFAVAYADQVQLDYQSFLAARRNGTPLY